ncbi:MAG: hypothetical protein GAK28_03180 [Luteibacter sp.]|uniref:hypothetical protein n=1 Tax=Luteibacter sp. TaxID=1886636 RepID=UPI001384E8D2|nr:hypothetical protein [Luteibacter sp.]KAF1005428.1 MAG: hypothetical protein GAK28_03180 [Luteibacter sp.]
MTTNYIAAALTPFQSDALVFIARGGAPRTSGVGFHLLEQGRGDHRKRYSAQGAALLAGKALNALSKLDLVYCDHTGDYDYGWKCTDKGVAAAREVPNG